MLAVTVIGVIPIFVAVPLRSTRIVVAPMVVPAAAVIVNVEEIVDVLNTATEAGAKVIPVAVGVSVISAFAAAMSNIS